MLGAGSSPGHDVKLAADGLGVLGSTEQLRGASLVQAVLGKDVPKLSNHLPIGNHLSGTGNKLLLALERDRNGIGERRKKCFSCRTGRLSYILRKRADAKLTSKQEEGIWSILQLSQELGVTQVFGMEPGEIPRESRRDGTLPTAMGPFLLRN